MDYDPKHLLPFLTDMFASMPRISNVAWYGARMETLRLFAAAWNKLQFTGKILLDQDLLRGEAITAISASQVLEQADAFIFDFGGLQSLQSSADGPADPELMAAEKLSQGRSARAISDATGAAPRRVICLNAINNDYEQLVCGSIAAPATPFATHMRHGFVLPKSAEWKLFVRWFMGGVRRRLARAFRSVTTNLTRCRCAINPESIRLTD